MTNCEWQDKTQLAYYLIFYADILGQRDKLRELRGLPRSADDWRRAVVVLRETAGFIKYVREWYQTFFDTCQRRESEFMSHLPTHPRCVVCEDSIPITYRCFSDSVTVAVCLSDRETDSYKPVNAVALSLIAACGVHLSCLSVGKAMRGGVDVGWGLPFPNGEVYGAALERAVHLEAQVAGYPRITVGEELEGYLQWVATSATSTPWGLMAARLAQRSQRLLFKDHDGQTALDFLGSEFKENVPGSTFDEQVVKAYEFVKSEATRWRSAGDTELSRRYGWLWSYFKSRAHVWGTDVQRLAEEVGDSK